MLHVQLADYLKFYYLTDKKIVEFVVVIQLVVHRGLQLHAFVCVAEPLR